jgi:hypothetical protein
MHMCRPPDSKTLAYGDGHCAGYEMKGFERSTKGLVGTRISLEKL